MGLTASQMARMSRLLDEALPLNRAGRLRWIEALAPQEQDLVAPLKGALLPEEGGDTLATLPKVESDGTSVSRLKPGDRVGPYRLERPLGSGGMAEVWLAQRADGAFKREVALKLPMLSQVRKDLARRFARERDILAGLEHANIARLYDAGISAEGLPYLAMEYVHGEPLIAWCDARRLDIRERLKLFLQVLHAVQYAHGRNVIHRDIKPSNVLVTDSGEVRLLDFGVAKLLAQEDEQTELTQVYGRALTPEYASPELVRGDPIDAAADVYSLGVVLYELLAGSRPYRLKPGASLTHLEQAIGEAPIERPSMQLGADASADRGTTQDKLARRLRGDLDAIVLQALAKAPADRYRSADALADDLQRYLSGEPVEARPDRFLYRLSKFVLRHRVGAARKSASAGVNMVQVGEGGASAAVAMPHNLPPDRTRFIGRRAELSACIRLLEDSRLLTLTGIGGSGKTRLAIELGRNLASRYPDGVRFADLSPVSSPDRVALQVARAVAVIEERDRPIEDTLARRLATRRMLLILDNCEHLLDPCAALVDRLLNECEHLQVIVTSREALGVVGEQVVPVRSLSLPPPDASVEAALRSEAVQLFVNRARLVAPEFEMTAQNVDASVDICRRLDGIPLAIELAASRLSVLSVKDIRQKLADRFRLLTAGSRTLARHQTLQAVLQWSYDHLTPEEQLLLRRVSVFAGGWSLEAALAIGGQTEGEIDLLDRLGCLVSKSLISVECQSDGATRYGMLETVRQYAHDRLQESGEAVAVHDAHLAYFLRFTTEVCALLPTQYVSATARIEREIQNLLAAHVWCDQPHVSPERGLELVGRSNRYWSERGPFTLGRQIFEEALRRPGAECPTRQRALALFSLGQHLCVTGRHEEAEAPLAEALLIARDHDDKKLQCGCIQWLAIEYAVAGRLKDANALVDQGLARAQSMKTPDALRTSQFSLGRVRQFESRFDEAAAAFRASIRLLPAGDLGNLNIGFRWLAQVSIAQGHLGEARKQVVESLLNARHLPHADIQASIETAARVAAACGDWKHAAWIQGAADATADRLGVARNAFDDPFLATLIKKPRECLGEAAYQAEWTAGHGAEPATAVDVVLRWLQRTPS